MGLWVRHRLTLNFDLKKNVEHFQTLGNKYYGKYVKDGFPKLSLYENIINILILLFHLIMIIHLTHNLSKNLKN